MKITSSFLLITGLSSAMLPFSACSKNDSAEDVAQNTKTAVKDAAHDAKQMAVDSWDTIKDFTFDQRKAFEDGIDHMGQTYDADLAAMNAKLNGLPEGTARTRDVAVKEFNSASAALKVQLKALRGSSADTWVAAKEKTVIAWQRVQTSFAALKTGVT